MGLYYKRILCPKCGTELRIIYNLSGEGYNAKKYFCVECLSLSTPKVSKKEQKEITEARKIRKNIKGLNIIRQSRLQIIKDRDRFRMDGASDLNIK